MKKIKIFRVLVLAGLSVSVCINVSAQAESKKENVKESYKEQLKNGTVPGLLFAKETPMLKQKEEKPEPPSGTIRDIKNGDGNNILKTGSVATPPSATADKAKNAKLASDDKYNNPDTKNSPSAKPPVIPSQEQN